MAEQNKSEFSTQQVVVSSRWNPTPEQLQALEELYRRGVQTPSAEQIQHITAQLRRYGKIEGKNVFYWFQNHKARERQKRRRQLDDDQESHNVNQIPKSERKKQSSAGENGTVFEVEQTNKKLASPKKCSTTIAKKSMPTWGAEGSKADGWVQFNEETELEERRNPSDWQMLHLSSSSPSPNNLINYSFSSVDTNRLRHQQFRSLDQFGGGCVEEQATLQLFPVRRPCEEDDRSIVVNYTSTATDVAPDHYQFFEFLPLKK